MTHFSQVDLSYYALLLAGLLPYLFTLLAKVGTGKKYNNHDPRAFLSEVEGRHKRANNAQLNSFEAFPFFLAGVWVAHQSQPAPTDFFLLNTLCYSFVGLRLLYGWAYITDQANLRSMIWFLGLGVVVSLFFI